MKRVRLLFLFLMLAAATVSAQSVLDFVARDIFGSETALESYRGEVLLIVNTASKCGFTYQFEGLQTLYDRYRDRGFVVLGFPSDNFANQEFESDADILGFCTEEYGVTFPMFSKIDVTGDEAHPLYQFLTSHDQNGEFGGPIGWNFTKFVVDRNGSVVARFGSRTEPEDPQVVREIERALGM